MVPMPTPALAAISRTGASTPEATNTAAAASSRACSLRRASARLREGADPPPPSASDTASPSCLVGLAKRSGAPYAERNNAPLADDARAEEKAHPGRARAPAEFDADDREKEPADGADRCTTFRDQHRPVAGRLPGHPAGLARGRYDPRNRARLAI